MTGPEVRSVARGVSGQNEILCERPSWRREDSEAGRTAAGGPVLARGKRRAQSYGADRSSEGSPR